MFGIMGAGSAFINAAGRGGRKVEECLKLVNENAGFEITKLSCTGEIRIESVVSGSPTVATYTDLNNAKITVQCDAQTEVVIYGAVTGITFDDDSPSTRITSFDTSKAKSLAVIDMTMQDIPQLDLTNNLAITTLTLSGLGTLILKLGDYQNITTCNIVGLSTAIQNVYTYSNNSVVANGVATLISNAGNNETVHTNSDGAYYSTIADAATAKGWTIEPL